VVQWHIVLLIPKRNPGRPSKREDDLSLFLCFGEQTAVTCSPKIRVYPDMIEVISKLPLRPRHDKAWPSILQQHGHYQFME